MFFWQLAGFIGSAIVLGGYFYSIRTGHLHVLNWANIIGSIIMFPANIFFGAFFGAFLTACFGAIGVYGVVSSRRRLTS